MPAAVAASAMDAAIRVLATATRIVVLSGAGLSRASGISTYRDAAGIWCTGDNSQFGAVDAYRRAPAAFVAFWGARQREMRRAQPNAAHSALHRLQQCKPATLLVTQNVDGLLQRAGCTNVMELHGNLANWWCARCERRHTHAVFGRCPGCFHLMRPDIVLFGEPVSRHLWHVATAAAKQCEAMLVVGTSAAVHPAAELPLRARQGGATVVVLDPEPPPLGEMGAIALSGRAEVLLPELIGHMEHASHATA